MEKASLLPTWAGLACLCALLLPSAAVAQYRSDALSLEVGGVAVENLPLTLANVGGSEAVARGLGNRPQSALGGRRFYSCAALLEAQGNLGWPCVNNYVGLTDGPLLGLGYHRSLGDLLLDISEAPLVRNIWFLYRGTVSLHATLPTQGFPLPAFMVQQEAGLRWNIWDETVRPYVAFSGLLHALVEPFTVGGHVLGMQDACSRLQSGQKLQSGEVCVDDSNWVQQSPVAVNPSAALFALNALPIFVGAAPEAGLEYFFMEDVSVAVHGGVQAMVALHPSYVFRAPFVALAPRAGVSVAAYF